MVKVDDPTWIQVTPSADSKPVMVLPTRVSLTQRTAVFWLPDVLMLLPPSARRRWNGTPFTGDDATSMKACAADGERELRIITPALVQAWTASMLVTRATIDPSPSSAR